MIARTFTSCISGFEGTLVTIEAFPQNALPQIQITGLPGTVIQESRERVRASLNFLGFSIPSKKLLVHLSPAETKKSGSHFDLAIAMSLLAVESCFPKDPLETFGFLGELSLDGSLKPIQQLIPLLEPLIHQNSITTILIPSENQAEAALFKSSKIQLCRNLKEAVEICFQGRARSLEPLNQAQVFSKYSAFSFDEILGMSHAKKTLVIALAGDHPLLLEGPPGSGKSRLAYSASSLVPRMDDEALLEVNRIYSFFGENRGNDPYPPFRSPHHSISAAAFLGGGSQKVIPGEISLAHRGVLFLDEFPEFRRDSIEGLREPLQSGEINLHRVSSSIRLPARFSLIAAMNPCPCGYAFSQLKSCSCAPESVRNYRKKLSGPILDRFSLYLWLDFSARSNRVEGFSQNEAQTLIGKVRSYKKEHRILGPMEIKNRFSEEARSTLDKLGDNHHLSFRKFQHFMAVGFTLALLNGRETIKTTDIEEAWSLKTPDAF